MAIEVFFEDRVDVHEDTVHDLIQLIGLLGFRNIRCRPNTAEVGCVLNLVVFVLADKFILVDLLEGPADVFRIRVRILEVGDTLLHVLDLTSKVPGSALSGVREASSGSHLELCFLRPLGLLDGSARACVRAQDLGRLVEDFIESAGVHVRVFREVLSHFERKLVVVILAEVNNNVVIHSPNCEDGDGNNEGEDKEEESAAGVKARAHAFPAPDHEASS